MSPCPPSETPQPDSSSTHSRTPYHSMAAEAGSSLPACWSAGASVMASVMATAQQCVSLPLSKPPQDPWADS
eukprot:1159823-Pelagomonas_calceolata.AAC.2